MVHLSSCSYDSAWSTGQPAITPNSQTKLEEMRVILEPGDSAELRAFAASLKMLGLAEVTEQELGAGDVEYRMRQAVEQMQEEGVLKRPFDHTWIMVVVQQGFADGLKPFGSPQSYREYLMEVGVELQSALLCSCPHRTCSLPQRYIRHHHP